jgi:hypothetical protein
MRLPGLDNNTEISSYANRELRSNAAKVALVERMRKRSGYTLTRTTLVGERKVNVFRWEPRRAQG